MELPEDCWELICKAIGEDDYQSLESLSLVSTTFLAITNRVRSTFCITDKNVPFLNRYLLRFLNLKRIRFGYYTKDLDCIIQQISLSGLDLELLDFLGAAFLCDSDLVSIGVCFPFIQELNLSCVINYSAFSDYGIISLSSSLKGLLKINISHNRYITDNALVALSQNCILLREVIIHDCGYISSKGIQFVLCNSRNLEFIRTDCIRSSQSVSFSSDTFLSAHCLSQLDLSDCFLSHESICLIADAKLPLQKLVLSKCEGLDFNGILCLLSKYQTLRHLDLERLRFLSDAMVLELRMFLRHLVSLNLNYCTKLTGRTFFSIIETSISLKSMEMKGVDFGMEAYDFKELDIKSRIESLYIGDSPGLRDECLVKVSRHCPFLKTLDVARCPGITKDGILEVLRNCSELRSLDISLCTGVKSLGVVDFELPKLVSLRARETWIDDEALDMISKRCRELLYLDLSGCWNMKSNGVKAVLRNCVLLRELKLDYCDFHISWMAFTEKEYAKLVNLRMLYQKS